MIKWAIIFFLLTIINKITSNNILLYFLLLVYNKLNYINNSNNLKNKLSLKVIAHKITLNHKNNEDFYQWLVGFTDGDGSFYIKSNNKCARFYYGFRLHIDDKICLDNIKYYLNIPSKIEELLKTIILLNSQKKWLYLNIVPIFDKYPCLTIKYYSYYKWKKELINSINIKNYNLNNDLKLISKTINNYNKIPNIIIPYNKINDNWILGFIEAEGSLEVLKNRNISALNVSQHERSIDTLKAIKSYILTNWKPVENTPNLIKSELLKNWDSIAILTKPDKNNVIKLEFRKLDFLYYVIAPKLLSLKWYSRKEVDFKLWKVVLNIYIKGLHNLEEGLNLLNLIQNNINKKRYNNNNIISDNIINKVLNIKPVYNNNLTYRINSDIIRLNKLNNLKTIKVGVFVYNINNELIITFTGIRPAAKYFDCTKHLISKYIKNNEVFQNKYILKNNLL